jgi:hypothetical protein
MINILKTIGLASAALVSMHAHAGITSLSIGGGLSEAGHNWSKGFQWHVRAILLDSTQQPIGFLSPDKIFDTTTAPLTPQNVTVTLDASASVGSIIRVYRSTTPFQAGDNTAYADFTICPCTAGRVQLTVTGSIPNSDFAATQPAMPVKLQDFSVD